MYEEYELAQAIAHNPPEVERLQADGEIDLTAHFVKIDGRQVNLFEAMHTAILRMAQGRRDEAECISGDCLRALATACVPVAREELKANDDSDDDGYLVAPPPKPDPDAPALWGGSFNAPEAA